ncbi:hypothetical protein ACFSM5_01620 [Lacibacterium aquatile]|uniref:Amino acid ABC transporter substrate-binding protein n=1 Tax=Lacibacterium aquatile TaxID=1168082 RepID=A0ABW5DM51_9PROT
MVLLTLAGWIVPADARELVTFARSSNDARNPRHAYSLGLLKLALEKAQVEADFVQADMVLEQSRAVEELAMGRGLRVIWVGTSPERERQLRPIRIPLDRGLLGLRLMMVRPDSLRQIAELPSAHFLRSFVMGQGVGWPDVQILESAGFKVVETSYDQLFPMLERGRVGALPRAAFEIRSEIDAQQRLGRQFAIDPRFAISYRFCSFFFTNRADEALASAIERGLEAAYDDGSFMAYFETHPYTGGIVQALQLEKREILAIDNPLLTPETRALPPRYWLFP